MLGQENKLLGISAGIAGIGELKGSFQAVKETALTIWEDPIGVGAYLANSAVETGAGVLRGDARSVTNATGAIASLATPGVLLKGARLPG